MMTGMNMYEYDEDDDAGGQSTESTVVWLRGDDWRRLGSAAKSENSWRL